MAGNMTNTVINGLLAELAGRGITLVVDGGQLIARGPAGAMTPELAQRLKQHKAALVEALTSGPAEAQAVEVNAPALASGLPPGWPSNTPKPPWWPEFLDCLGSIRLLAAREQMCGDPTCGFSVAILWTDGKTAEWSCPKCGRTSGPIVQQKCRRCGSTQYHDVPIHNGKSIRRDCARCGRFLDFPAWHGTQ